MYLKGHLWLTVPRAVLKDDLGHNLPRIWERFKATIGDSRLPAFDRTIQDVHSFEALRYPETIIETGMRFHFEIARAALDRSLADDQGLGNVPLYVLALEEVDQLVHRIFDVSNLNPKVFLRGRLGNARRRECLLQSNSAWNESEV